MGCYSTQDGQEGPEFSKGGKWVGIWGTAEKVTQAGGWRSWEEVTVAEVSWGWERDWGTTGRPGEGFDYFHPPRRIGQGSGSEQVVGNAGQPRGRWEGRGLTSYGSCGPWLEARLPAPTAGMAEMAGWQ